MANVGSVQQVGRVQDFQRAQLTEDKIRHRIELHTGDTMERFKAIRAEGLNISLPQNDPEQETQLRNAYSAANPEQQQNLVQASYNLAGALYNYASGLDSSAAGLQAATRPAMEAYIATTGEQNIEKLTLGTVSMGLDGVNRDVEDLAYSMKATMDMQKSYREDIAEFRNSLAEWPEGQTTQHFEWTEFDDTGKAVKKEGDFDKAGAQAKMKELEEKKETCGEDKQMLQLKLQDAMEKQQQALQMLSGIMKSFHDTAKAIIQNLRA